MSAMESVQTLEPVRSLEPVHAKGALRARSRRIALGMTALAAATLVAVLAYQFAFVNPKYFEYAMSLRWPRLAAMLTAAFAISAASLVFQTIIRNTIVTPCLLGMNSLYVLVHTGVFFFLGAGSAFATDPQLAFFLDLAVMGVVATFVFRNRYW